MKRFIVCLIALCCLTLFVEDAAWSAPRIDCHAEAGVQFCQPHCPRN
ncbi:MAG: hypothetical protein RR091_09170 [Cloacibacillus sp.]